MKLPEMGYGLFEALVRTFLASVLRVMGVENRWILVAIYL
jgi:hypothetical protein